jgi:hypothetical protein
MAQDAIKRGFPTVAIQARHSLQTLRLCRDNGIRAILNHRAAKDSRTGHYSVFVDMDDKDIILHDPFAGPSRRLSHAEMLELWHPGTGPSEIVGHMLIAIAPPGLPDVAACEFCHTSMPGRVECPRCKQGIGLRPTVVMGCVNQGCIARMWNYICCPSCDFTWNFSLQPGSAPMASAEAPVDAPGDKDAEKEPVSLTELFAQLDKFTSYARNLPAAAQNAEVLKQIAFIASQKEKLTLARAEGLSNLKAHEARMAAMARESAQRAEAHRQKVESMKKTSPRLDGKALGHSLLKTLGFR